MKGGAGRRIEMRGIIDLGVLGVIMYMILGPRWRERGVRVRLVMGDMEGMEEALGVEMKRFAFQFAVALCEGKDHVYPFGTQMKRAQERLIEGQLLMREGS
jgi:hypothetical protein